MTNTPVTLTIIRSMAEDVVKQLALSQHIGQPGESGRAREQILTAFIRQLVPSTFSVSAGFALTQQVASANK
jgi:hypothetical protein